MNTFQLNLPTRYQGIVTGLFFALVCASITSPEANAAEPSATGALPTSLNLDASFECKLVLRGQGDDSPRRATPLIVQPDGKILVSAMITGDRVRGIARLHPDGAVDTSFNADPSLRKALALQPDGRILALAASDGVVRLLPDGSPDVSFSSPKMETLDGGANDIIMDTVVQADGKVIVAGQFFQFFISPNPHQVERPGLARLNADGSLDESYSPIFGTASYRARVEHLHLDAEGRLLVVGHDPLLGVLLQPLVRLLANGSIDPGFQADLRSGVGAIFGTDSDGSILVASGNSSELVRLKRDGSRDPEFHFEASNGAPRQIVLAQVTATGILLGESIAVDPDTISPLFEVTRLNWNGSRQAVLARAALSWTGVRATAPAVPGRWLIAGVFNGVDGVPQQGIARLFTDESGLPNLEFTASRVTAFEDLRPVHLTIRRAFSAAGAASVAYKTSDLTARAGKDYIEQNGVVQFAEGEREKKILIPILGNKALDQDRNFVRISVGSESRLQKHIPMEQLAISFFIG